LTVAPRNASPAPELSVGDHPVVISILLPQVYRPKGDKWDTWHVDVPRAQKKEEGGRKEGRREGRREGRT
jgi:hypothetical protein